MQVCGLWPLIVGGVPPMVGVPLGPAVDGQRYLCADHISWFERGLISAPSAMILALNGIRTTTCRPKKRILRSSARSKL